MAVSPRALSGREAEGVSASCAPCNVDLGALALQQSRLHSACSQYAAIQLWIRGRYKKVLHALAAFDDGQSAPTSDTTLPPPQYPEHEYMASFNMAKIDCFENNPFIGKQDTAMVSDLVNSFLNAESSYSREEKMKVARLASASSHARHAICHLP